MKKVWKLENGGTDAKITEGISNNTSSGTNSYPYEEAFELTGHGRYNYMCLITCCIINLAVAVDMFGFSITVVSSGCDLKIGIRETGFLASAPFAGFLLSFPWGYFADARGRKSTLVISTLGGFALSTLSSLSPSWQVMLGLKVAGCFFSTAAYSLAITYLGECTGKKRRNRYIFILNSFNLAAEMVHFGLAYFILPLEFNYDVPWLSIAFRPWRLLVILMAVPLGVGAFLLLFLEESPQFLADKGENESALQILNKIHKINNKGEYHVKSLMLKDVAESRVNNFWLSLKKQSMPIFTPPLLKRTLQLFYLTIICISTNNIFIMWFAKLINSLFTSDDYDGFCQKITSNATIEVEIDDKGYCDDSISAITIYSGICYGIFFMMANLIVSQLAEWRRTVLVMTLLISALSGVLTVLLKHWVVNVATFILLQGTQVAAGAVASYFVDLYPTSCRSLINSLGAMSASAMSLVGVNVISVVIIDYCDITFYSWSMFVLSGALVALLLPSKNTQT